MPTPLFEVLQVTAEYSNAVLVAIMPYVADFAKRLELPIPQPVTMGQVERFNCSPRTDLFGGRVILTNGYEFAFLHGRVEMYRNPKSYYELQEPRRVLKFFGPVNLNEKEAVRAAREAVRKLGYAEGLLFTDRKPEVKPPPKFGRSYVPRYWFRWTDPTRGDPRDPPATVELEVDATTGRIQTMYLLGWCDTWRPDPKVDVHPPVIGEGPKTQYVGGRKMVPVSQAYSNAFLAAILPQCAQYVKTAGFSVRVPILTNDVDMASYSLGLVDGDPCAFLDLKTGERFIYSHGQVIAFFSSDVMNMPGRENPRFPAYEKFQAQFYGRINMTTNQAAALVRETVKRLGYSTQVLHMDERPHFGGPNRWGTNWVARCFVRWDEPGQGATRAIAEVDMASKKVRSLYINDHVNTNIWRNPPKIDVPIGAVAPGHEEPPPAPAPKVPVKGS
jgi:hypothetical protein